MRYFDGRTAIACDTSYTDEVDSVDALTVGVGIERKLNDNLSISMEYLAIRGQAKTVIAANDSDDIFRFDTDADMFIIGFSYSF